MKSLPRAHSATARAAIRSASASSSSGSRDCDPEREGDGHEGDGRFPGEGDGREGDARFVGGEFFPGEGRFVGDEGFAGVPGAEPRPPALIGDGRSGVPLELRRAGDGRDGDGRDGDERDGPPRSARRRRVGEGEGALPPTLSRVRCNFRRRPSRCSWRRRGRRRGRAEALAAGAALGRRWRPRPHRELNGQHGRLLPDDGVVPPAAQAALAVAVQVEHVGRRRGDEHSGLVLALRHRAHLGRRQAAHLDLGGVPGEAKGRHLARLLVKLPADVAAAQQDVPRQRRQRHLLAHRDGAPRRPLLHEADELQRRALPLRPLDVPQPVERGQRRPGALARARPQVAALCHLELLALGRLGPLEGVLDGRARHQRRRRRRYPHAERRRRLRHERFVVVRRAGLAHGGGASTAKIANSNASAGCTMKGALTNAGNSPVPSKLSPIFCDMRAPCPANDLEPDQVVTLDQLPCSPAEYLQRIKAWTTPLEFGRRVAEEARGDAKQQPREPPPPRPPRPPRPPPPPPRRRPPRRPG